MITYRLILPLKKQSTAPHQRTKKTLANLEHEKKRGDGGGGSKQVSTNPSKTIPFYQNKSLGALPPPPFPKNNNSRFCHPVVEHTSSITNTNRTLTQESQQLQRSLWGGGGNVGPPLPHSLLINPPPPPPPNPPPPPPALTRPPTRPLIPSSIQYFISTLFSFSFFSELGGIHSLRVESKERGGERERERGIEMRLRGDFLPRLLRGGGN